jgi:hypothetical protein
VVWFAAPTEGTRVYELDNVGYAAQLQRDMERHTDTTRERYWVWLMVGAILIAFDAIAVFMGWK